MPFNWLDFLTRALTLSTNGDPASKRTAIRRAYYFVFHLAYDRALSTGCVYPGGVPTHAWCWQKYSSTADAACSAVGTEGERLKRLRHKADYQSPDIPRLDQVCSRMLADVQQLHADIMGLNAQHPTP